MLVDQYGKPLKKQTLLEEKARPNVMSVRSPFSGSVTHGMNPSRLAGIISRADRGDIGAYLSLAEEVEEKDPHYLAVIGTRKRAVSQLEITVEPASDDKEDIINAELVQDWLDRDQLEGEIFNILDAIGKGFSVTEIMWDMSESQWMPKDIVWRDPRWFRFDHETGQDLYLRDRDGLQPLQPYKFIVHKHQAKSGLPARGGLIRPCAWMWLFKNFSIKDWVIFSEAYSQPIRLGKYGAGTSEDDRDILMRAVANIGSDAAAIIPESMQLEFIEATQKSATAEGFERFSKFADLQMSKAVLGQTTTTDAVSGGHAVSKEHNEVREDIERADAKQLAPSLNEQLVVPIVTLNRGPQKKYPRLRIGRSESIDIDIYSQVVERAIRSGIRVSERKTLEKLGLDAPEDDADVIGQLPGNSKPSRAEAKNKTPVTAASEHNHHDPIDELGDELGGEWEEIMDPVVALLEKAAEESGSYEEFSEKLLTVADKMNMPELAEKLARGNFVARLAGAVDAELE